jgi:hypothetical protein
MRNDEFCVILVSCGAEINEKEEKNVAKKTKDLSSMNNESYQ